MLTITTESADSIYKKLQTYKKKEFALELPALPVVSESSLKKWQATLRKKLSKSSSTSLPEKSSPSMFALIVLQMTKWALTNKFPELTLVDMAVLLLKMTAEKEEVATVLIEYLSAHELNKIIDIMLKFESQRVVKEQQFPTFMRSNTVLTAIFAKQNHSVIFAKTLIDRLPQEVKKFKEDHHIPNNKQDLEIELKGNVYKKYLGDYLFSLDKRVKHLPDVVKYNCYLIYKNLKEANAPDNIILNKIGGYLFLRLINPSMTEYVQSPIFKDVLKKCVSDNDQELMLDACFNIVKFGLCYPVQLVSNFIDEQEKTDNNNPSKGQQAAQRKGERSTWIRNCYDLACKQKESLKKCLMDLTKTFPIANTPPLRPMPANSEVSQAANMIVSLYLKGYQIKQKQDEQNNTSLPASNSSVAKPVVANPTTAKEELLKDLRDSVFGTEPENYQNLDLVNEYISFVEELYKSPDHADNNNVHHQDHDKETTNLLVMNC